MDDTLAILDHQEQASAVAGDYRRNTHSSDRLFCLVEIFFTFFLELTRDRDGLIDHLIPILLCFREGGECFD